MTKIVSYRSLSESQVVEINDQFPQGIGKHLFKVYRKNRPPFHAFVATFNGERVLIRLDSKMNLISSLPQEVLTEQYLYLKAS